MNSDGFSSLDSQYALRTEKDSGYLCFPLRMENLHSQNVTLNTNHNSDSSTNALPTACGQMLPFDKSCNYFQSRTDGLSYTTHQCSPSFSDFSPGSKTDGMLHNVVRTRRRKAGISDEERICIVCGEPASGYNFDRLTCESCKAFFRRNALKPKDKIKVCTRGGGCIIEGNQRKHCPSCRLEKCFAVGMKRELILPPEKLEQRAKPRRRKPNSPQGDSCSPLAVNPPHPQSLNSGTIHAPPPPCLPMGSHHRPPVITDSPPPPQLTLNPGLDVARHQSVFSQLQQPHRPILNPIDSNPSDCHPCWPDPPTYVRSTADLDKGACKLEQQATGPDRSSAAFVPCRYTNGRTVCRHQRCRRLRWRSVKAGMNPYGSDPRSIPVGGLGDDEPNPPDARVLGCLRECAQRIREPFTPDEKLDTGVAVTLEQEYNRMDACIRRIIRVVKLLPHFNDTGKQAQLCLLRTNIYGLLVLYSSFFYERSIRKLRYPILQFNGEQSFVTISMLDEVVTPSSPNASCSKDSLDDDSLENFFGSNSTGGLGEPTRHSAELREEFELYKVNTLTAFEHLDRLIGPDDILRVTLFAIKLFTDESMCLTELHASVEHARQTYLLFLWSYLRWRAGSKQLRSATELYARLLISFIDLRTLETRMTDFAKLLSLDGLSPLMREVCSQRPMLGATKA